MVDDPNARDFGAVRTPVLAFLIQHELFRIALADTFRVVTGVKEKVVLDYSKRTATKWRNSVARWEKVFSEFNGRASTTQLAGAANRSNVSVGNSMRKLSKLNIVVRDGAIKHNCNGHDQIIWKWIGNGKT